MLKLPRLYAIAESSCFRSDAELCAFAEQLIEGGVSWLQFRDKSGDAQRMLRRAEELRRRVGDRATLIMNDRSDLCVAAGFQGVHVGWEDLPVELVRRMVGPDVRVGVSTHNPQQLSAADQSSADYVAIGPVFPTVSKGNPDPVVGLEGVRRARPLTRKPLVAIGGITRDNCYSVVNAGADAVAVISDLLPGPRKSAEEFLRILR
jgi:thiamine-phosphate pyrophosphorylase